MSWHREPLIGFDLETTGTDIETDRIVTAAVVTVDPAERLPEARTWLLDPGVTISEEATAIHGISTEHARLHGEPAASAIEEITSAVSEVLNSGTPLVVMNARYDLSLLDRECRRHGIEPLVERLRGGISPIIDPLVLDKYVDRYRKGKRNLRALCEHYGVQLDDAHNAVADAVAAARTARRMGEKHSAIGGVAPVDLHDLQVRTAAEQAASLQRYLRRTSNPEATVEPAWPVVPHGR
ncbi:3'-5' exonuclease [Streptomyces kebangsaanensis]|uniref:3'-5' exonuclease n=1 Tax=Streptomyces kebangsaanensis TaxID=864058 RepID=UPI00093D5E27|nr:3'-5' exonuclease [Streptomyces kebangsaanensis]